MRVFECAEGLCFIGKLFLDAAYLRMRVGAVLDDTLGVRARSAVRRRGVVISAILAVCKDANNYDAETHYRVSTRCFCIIYCVLHGNLNTK